MQFHRHLTAMAVALVAAGGAGSATAAAPSLGMSGAAQTWGNISADYSSVVLGDVRINLSVPGSSYLSFDPLQGTTGLATLSYQLASGQSGLDPLYAIVTNAGQYGFSFETQAQLDRLRLRTGAATTLFDSASGTAVEYAPTTQISGAGWAQWSQDFYIGATATRPAGSYGAVLVRLTLHGDFPAVPDVAYNNSWAYLTATSAFSDTAGVSYNSSYTINATGYDGSWTGSSTVYKKLLFQYGTPFSVSLYQQSYAYNTGNADFTHTGEISSIEIPFGATLETGATQLGLGNLNELFGNVFQSATPDAENTNWDFGNNGGGFTPNVPEPGTWMMLLAGLAVTASLARRRQPQA